MDNEDEVAGHNMFFYGTLMNPSVRETIIGRIGTTYSDALPGYAKNGLNITEEEGSVVEGVTMEVSDEELARLDGYESVGSGLYLRKEVKLASGEMAYVYQKTNPDQVVIGMGDIG